MQGFTLENAHGQDNGVKGATRPMLLDYLAHAIISLVVLKEGDNTWRSMQDLTPVGH